MLLSKYGGGAHHDWHHDLQALAGLQLKPKSIRAYLRSQRGINIMSSNTFCRRRLHQQQVVNMVNKANGP